MFEMRDELEGNNGAETAGSEAVKRLPQLHIVSSGL